MKLEIGKEIWRTKGAAVEGGKKVPLLPEHILEGLLLPGAR